MNICILGPDDLIDEYDVNFVSFRLVESFYANHEKDPVRSLYDNLYNMKKVFSNIPYMRRTLSQHLKIPALESCPFIALVQWPKIMQRIVYLATYLDQQPP